MGAGAIIPQADVNGADCVSINTSHEPRWCGVYGGTAILIFSLGYKRTRVFASCPKDIQPFSFRFYQIKCEKLIHNSDLVIVLN